jgi:hypothetical protein
MVYLIGTSSLDDMSNNAKVYFALENKDIVDAA